MELHALAVPQNWNQKAGGGGDCDWDVDEVSPDDLFSVDDWVDDWVFFEGQGAGFQEEGHEA